MFLESQLAFHTRSASETENWRERNRNIKQRDIDQWRHKIYIVYIAIDDVTFQQTFVNKTSKDSLKISIHAY